MSRPTPGLLVIAPHPDDETLGAGGLIERVRAKGGTVRVVLITAGDGFLEAMAHMRPASRGRSRHHSSPTASTACARHAPRCASSTAMPASKSSDFRTAV